MGPVDDDEPEEMPQEDILRVGVLEKKIISNVVSWEARKAVLTKTHLCFSMKDETAMLEHIPLHEIINVFIEGQKPGQNKPRQPAEEGAADEMGGLLRSLSIDDAAKDVSSSKDAPQVMVIRTELWGHCFGRTFSYRCSDDKSFLYWYNFLTDAMRQAKQQYEEDEALQDKKGFEKQIWMARRVLRKVHDTNIVYQMALTTAITMSFICDIMEAELKPTPRSEGELAFLILDIIFTTVFMMEQGMMLFAFGTVFFTDVWNCLDLSLVLFSFVGLIAAGVSEIREVKIIRTLKIFRVVRLIRTFKAAHRIIGALARGLIPGWSRWRRGGGEEGRRGGTVERPRLCPKTLFVALLESHLTPHQS